MYVRAEDEGTYSVIARNQQGEVKSASKLKIETPTPHIPNPAQRPQIPTSHSSNGVLSQLNQNFKRPSSGNTQERKTYKKPFQTKNPIVDWTQNPPTIVCEDCFQTVKQVFSTSENNYNRPFYKCNYPCKNFLWESIWTRKIYLCLKKRSSIKVFFSKFKRNTFFFRLRQIVFHL